MLILGFDTETTGLPDWKAPSGDECQPHIVQLAAQLIETDNKEVIQSMDVIVRPDGWDITQETIDVHGITQEHAMDVGIPEKMALEMFLELWNGRKRIAFNSTFDNRIIRIGTKRYFGEDVIARWKEGKQGDEWECMMLAARKIMGGKQPKLTEAYKHFTGQELEGAHRAMADTEAMMSVYWAVKAHEAASA
ncbi:MAG TPA: 3'-5' exonuclease [Gammaproteobacteria bacterium]|nr:3'-5' exonuclease [Gammaproteobacteria bacterium]